MATDGPCGGECAALAEARAEVERLASLSAEPPICEDCICDDCDPNKYHCSEDATDDE